MSWWFYLSVHILHDRNELLNNSGAWIPSSLFLEHQFQTFSRRLHVSAAAGQLPGVGQHSRDAFVIVARVVVEEEKLLHPGALGQLNHIVYATVTPANV